MIKKYTEYINESLLNKLEGPNDEEILNKETILKGIKEVINFKPTIIFDEKYGTNLSQIYNFPFGLTADEVWNIISYSNKYYDKYKKESNKLIDVLNNLSEEHFPYTDLSNLDINQKIDLLFGMSSCFNSDDIIWFVVNGIKYSDNTKINYELNKLPREVVDDIQWVVSPKTLIKLKELTLQTNESLLNKIKGQSLENGTNVNSLKYIKHYDDSNDYTYDDEEE